MFELLILDNSENIKCIKILRKYIPKYSINKIKEIINNKNIIMIFERTDYSDDFFSESRALDNQGDLPKLIEIIKLLNQESIKFKVIYNNKSLSIKDVEKELDEFEKEKEDKKKDFEDSRLNVKPMGSYILENAKNILEGKPVTPRKLSTISYLGEETYDVDNPAIYSFAKYFINEVYDPTITYYEDNLGSGSKQLKNVKKNRIEYNVHFTMLDFLARFEDRKDRSVAFELDGQIYHK